VGQVGGGPRGTMTVTAAHWRVCCPTGQQTWIEQQIPTPSQASPLLRAAPAARGPRAAPRPGTRRSSGRAARRWRRARRASPASWPAPGCARRAPRAAAAAAPGGPAAAAAQAALPQCPRHLPTPTRQRQGRSWTEPHTPAPARRQQGALWTGNPYTVPFPLRSKSGFQAGRGGRGPPGRASGCSSFQRSCASSVSASAQLQPGQGRRRQAATNCATSSTAITSHSPSVATTCRPARAAAAQIRSNAQISTLN